MRIVIIGAGFAGMYAAISAARLRHLQGVSPADFEISLIAPEPFLVIRPRLYEANPETMKAPLTELFQATDVRYVQGTVETIDSGPAWSSLPGPTAGASTLAYDRLVLAAGSTGFRPNIPGLAQHAFGVEQMDEAIKLDEHLHALAKRPFRRRATPSSSQAAASPGSRPRPRCLSGCVPSWAATPTSGS